MPVLRLAGFRSDTSYIYLPEGEVIAFYDFADKMTFRFIPVKDINNINTNIGFIHASRAGADTNLNIIGESGNIYTFYVRSDNHRSGHLPHLKVFVEDERFREKLIALNSLHNAQEKSLKEEKPKKTEEENSSDFIRDVRTDEQIGDYLRSIDNTPLNRLHRMQGLDFRYTIFFRKNLISPMMIFDDGYWTYFKMTDKENLDQLEDYPVIFEVVEGIEQPVNTRTINNYIIAENLGQRWALRVGERFLCIEKDVDDSEVFLKGLE